MPTPCSRLRFAAVLLITALLASCSGKDDTIARGTGSLLAYNRVGTVFQTIAGSGLEMGYEG